MLLYFHHNIGSMRFMRIMPTSGPNISGVIGSVFLTSTGRSLDNLELHGL